MPAPSLFTAPFLRRFCLPVRLLWCLSLALALASCGGGSSAPAGPKSPVVPPPTQVTVAYAPALLEVTLSWVTPVSTVDGFVIEARLQGQEFKPIQGPLIPGLVHSVTLTFTEAPSELSTYEFQMRSLVGTTYSAYSNSASFTVPPVPPGYLTAHLTTDARGILLSWYQGSRVAPTMILERTATDLKGEPLGEWVPLAEVPSTVSTWTDVRVEESVNYRYRAISTLKGLSSLPAVSEVQRIPPFLPTGFAATSESGAVRLSWINQSRTAKQIQILRTPPATTVSEVLATVDPATSVFVDANLRPGVYAYRIRVADEVVSTLGGSAQASPLNPPEAPALARTALPSPPYGMDTACLTPLGSWYYGSSVSNDLTVFPHFGAAWEAPILSGATLSGKGFTAVDPHGFPHLVFGSTTSATPIPGALVHTWFDGQDWRFEKIAGYDGSGSGYPPQLCIGPSGTPSVVASGGLGSNSWSSLRYFTRIGDSWVTEALGPSLGGVDGWNLPHLKLDPAGHPHIMLTRNDSLVELSRSAEGVWTALPVTDAHFRAGLNRGKGLWVDQDHGWYFFTTTAGQGPNYTEIRGKAKVGGVWQPSIQIDACGWLRDYEVALSPDGARMALLLDTDRGRLLYTRTLSDWVGSTLPVDPNQGGRIDVQFDGAGKLHVLMSGTATTHWRE